MTLPNSAFLFNAFSIVLIDILLAGDNAVVIAMAVKSLPPDQRRRGILRAPQLQSCSAFC